MSNQLTTRTKDLKNILSSDNMREQFAKALPKHLKPERFIRCAITALTRTPKLAECTQESFMKCLLDLSAFGLEPDGRRAHLIPYKDTCTLIIDWKGLAELAMRSGIIAKLHADLVCENDEFDYNLGTILKHKIDFRKERGEPYAAYAMAETKDGAVFVAVMTKAEIEKVRNGSQGYKSAMQYNKSNPWLTDPGEMWKKTCFRRLSKWLPLSAEFRDAVERDDDQEHISERDITPPAAATSKLFKSQALPDPEPEPAPGHNLAQELEARGIDWHAARQHLLDNGLIAELYDHPDGCTQAEAAQIINLLPAIAESLKGGAA